MRERGPQNRADTHTSPGARVMKDRMRLRRAHIGTSENAHDEHKHHDHHEDHEHAENKKLVTRKWQIGTVAGNAIIGASEIATGQFSTLSVAADGFHNFGDAFTYYTQTESVLNAEQSKERKQKLRKLGYWILFGTSAAIAAKTAYDLSTEQEHTAHPLTIYTASASLALNSILASTMYRRYRKRNKEGIQDKHEHDIVKHLITDSASAALAFGGAVAQKYGITDLEPYAALGGAAITGWAFRPTKSNLEHSHDHFSEDHDHAHGHGHGHHEVYTTNDQWKHVITPTAARLAFAVVDNNIITQGRINRKQRSDFVATSPAKLQAMIQTANDISLESRMRSYEGDGKSFEQRNREWNSAYWLEIKRLTSEDADDDLRTERLVALTALGINVNDDSTDDSGMLNAQVEYFRQKYVGSRGSDIGQFVEDISYVCKNADDSVNLGMLEKRLHAIEPLLSAFGTVYDVHLLVKDFAIAHGMLAQYGKKSKEIAAYAAKQLKKSAQEEHTVRLRALHAMQQVKEAQSMKSDLENEIQEIEIYANQVERKLALAS